ncbi:uncharacterized protein LOC112202032 isoform X3 [Rosa chinensis]|uniref:uncharacterized protein LOC112202032 isoform X3 n=1 Tax=Rosa chinensis TaxID=74649 RepID=UPI001AD91E53|nr:uncharacterized protein LOC112202032 isoform X3 [Rosa chinensis]
METELETETGCQSLKRRRSCAIDGLNSMSRFCTGFSAFEIGSGAILRAIDPYFHNLHRCVSSAKACCQLSEVQNKYRSCGVIISEFQTFDFNGIKARTATAVQTPEFQFEAWNLGTGYVVWWFGKETREEGRLLVLVFQKADAF